MPNASEFDAIILGTGQAGKPLAGALAGAGWKTAIVERGRVGGTCIVTGCTPTKTMVASARIAHLARRAPDFGVRTGDVSLDLVAVRARKRQIVESWSNANRRKLEETEGVELIQGEGTFTGPHRIEVRMRKGGTVTLEAGKIFINTGARPRIPHIAGLGDVDYLDSTSIMELDEVPEHLLVLGGGFAGLEFSQMFRRFGSEVTIFEKSPRLVAREDPDVSEAVHEILVDDGIRLRLGTEVVAIRNAREGGIAVRFRTSGGLEKTREGSHLLVVAGRVPNSDALGAETVGLELDARGFVETNDRLETSIPGVYALGDVNGGPPFTHVSYDDFRVVRDRLLEGKDSSRAGRVLSYTVYIDPQLGRVGMSEAQAREAGLSIRVAKLPMTHVARAVERDETRGFMKAVVEAETGRILGCAVLGIEGGELASMIRVAMMGGLDYSALREGIFSHPSLSESLNNLFAHLEP